MIRILFSPGGSIVGDELGTPVRANPPHHSMPRGAVVCQGEPRSGQKAGGKSGYVEAKEWECRGTWRETPQRTAAPGKADRQHLLEASGTPPSP